MAEPQLLEQYYFIIYFISPYTLFCTALNRIYDMYLSYDWCTNAIQRCVDFRKVQDEICLEAVCSSDPKCCDFNRDYFSWKYPGVAQLILGLIAFTVITFIFCICAEYIYNKGSLHHTINKVIFRWREPEHDTNADDDVLTEIERVHNLSQAELKNQAIILKDVTKYHSNVLALKRITLGVRKGECFGLVGANGAGKSSLIRLITRESLLCYGTIHVNPNKAKKKNNKNKRCIGYCPQYGGLLDNLTAKENLVIYGLIRGVQETIIINVTEEIARQFDYVQFMDRQLKYLSNGIRRKIAISMAFIGDPEIILLDEPTTDVDHTSKDFIWNNINAAKESGKCIILASNSLSECEALCTRLAILVNGQCVCIGPTLHLIEKYTTGLTLSIKLRKDHENKTEQDLQDVEDYITNETVYMRILEMNDRMIKFQIMDTGLQWSQLFAIVENGKKKLKRIEGYSIGLSSLEEVFLTFVPYQRRSSLYLHN